MIRHLHTLELTDASLWMTAVRYWSIYLVLMVAYCSGYHIFVDNKLPDVLGDLIWAFNMWGFWLVLTPVVLALLKQSETEGTLGIKTYAVIALSVFIVTMTFRVLLDQVMLENASIPLSIYAHFARYAVATAALIAVWFFLIRAKDDESDQAKLNREAQTLLVCRGNDKCLIRVEDIHYASAARNYVELYTNEASYLIRSSISGLEERLPKDLFVRTHRSNIVNIRKIERIKRLPSGSGKVILENSEVPISKNYMAQLRNYA